MISEYILLSLLSNVIVFITVLDKDDSLLLAVIILFFIKLVLFEYNEKNEIFDNDTLMMISFIIVMAFFEIIK